jgi:hypothetical protein
MHRKLNQQGQRGAQSSRTEYNPRQVHHRVHPERYEPEGDGGLQITVEHIDKPQEEYQSYPEARPFPEPGHL